MVTEDFVALLVDLNEIQRKMFWRTCVPHVVLAESLAFSDHDVEMALQAIDVSCRVTDVATSQKVNHRPSFGTLSANSTVQLSDFDPSSTIVHNFVVDSLKSKKNHPALEGVPNTLWATHKYDVGLIKDATPLVVVLKSDYRPNTLSSLEQLLRDEIIVQAPTSPCNTLFYPVKKADGKSWQPVHDLRTVRLCLLEHQLYPTQPQFCLLCLAMQISSL